VTRVLRPAPVTERAPAPSPSRALPSHAGPVERMAFSLAPAVLSTRAPLPSVEAGR
jgi:hypothetical protein